jgi:hypothetical protein
VEKAGVEEPGLSLPKAPAFSARLAQQGPVKARGFSPWNKSPSQTAHLAAAGWSAGEFLRAFSFCSREGS